MICTYRVTALQFSDFTWTTNVSFLLLHVVVFDESVPSVRWFSFMRGWGGCVSFGILTVGVGYIEGSDSGGFDDDVQYRMIFSTGE